MDLRTILELERQYCDQLERSSEQWISSQRFIFLHHYIVATDSSYTSAMSVVKNTGMPAKEPLSVKVYQGLFDYYAYWMAANEFVGILKSQKFRPQASKETNIDIMAEFEAEAFANGALSEVFELNYPDTFQIHVEVMLRAMLDHYKKLLIALLEMRDKPDIDLGDVNDDPDGPSGVFELRDKLEYVRAAFNILTHSSYTPDIVEEFPQHANLVGKSRFDDMDIKKFTIELKATDADLRKLISYLNKNQIYYNIDEIAPDTFWWRHRNKKM